MAMVHDVRTDTAPNCLRDLADSIGTYESRDPIPPWWGDLLVMPGSLKENLTKVAAAIEQGQLPRAPWFGAFDAWRVGFEGHSTFVRTEAFTYADAEDDEPAFDDDDREDYDGEDDGNLA